MKSGIENAFDINDILVEMKRAAELKKTPAFLFDRVSHTKQRDGVSLEYQLDFGNYYVDRNDLHIVASMVIVESAYKENRKYFTRALDTAVKLQIKNLVFKNPDRLSRNILHMNRIMNLIEKEGFVFHFYETGQRIHGDVHYDEKLMFYQFILMNQRHSMKLSHDVKEVYKYKASKGIPFHRPGYGYSYSKELKMPVFDNEENARFVYDEFDTLQYSLDEFVSLLNARGVPAPSGGAWVKSSLHYTLTSTFPHGEFQLHGVTFQGKYPVYYDKERYDKRMAYLQERNVGRRKYYRSYAFSGILACECGSVMTGDTKKGRYVYYKCNRERTYTPEAEIHERIDRAFESFRYSEQFAGALKDCFARTIETKIRCQEPDVREIRRRITDLEKSQDKFMALYQESKIDVRVLERNINDIQRQIDALEKQRKTLRIDKSKFIVHVAEVVDMLRTLPDVYALADEAGRVDLLKTMANRVVIYPDSAIIEWKKPYSFILQKKILRLSAGVSVGDCPVVLPR